MAGLPLSCQGVAQALRAIPERSTASATSVKARSSVSVMMTSYVSALPIWNSSTVTGRILSVGCNDAKLQSGNAHIENGLRCGVDKAQTDALTRREEPGPVVGGSATVTRNV